MNVKIDPKKQLKLVVRGWDELLDALLTRGDFLRGKYILVTGVADAEGLNAQALQLADRMGVAGIVLIDIDPRVEDVARGLKARTLVLKLDVSNKVAMAEAEQAIDEFLGENQFSLVLAGAGVFSPSSALDVDVEGLLEAFMVTVVGTIYTFKLAKRFAAKKCIFIGAGSAAALADLPEMVIYNVVKAALEALINSLKAEYASTEWEFWNMMFAQVEGTQLSKNFFVLEFAKEFLARNRGARIFNRHARSAPAARGIIRMGMGGWRARVFRFYPIRVSALGFFPEFVRPVVHAIIGTKTITEADRDLIMLDMQDAIARRELKKKARKVAVNDN